MSYNFYHSIRLQNTKMETLDPGKFVPEWKVEEAGEDAPLLQNLSAEKSSLAAKALAVLGLKRS